MSEKMVRRRYATVADELMATLIGKIFKVERDIITIDREINCFFYGALTTEEPTEKEAAEATEEAFSGQGGIIKSIEMCLESVDLILARSKEVREIFESDSKLDSETK